jgi:type VI secretion system protein ImpL
MTVLAQPASAVQDSKDTKDLRQARLNTEVLLRQLDKDVRDDLRPLLIQPFLVAQATASKGEIEGLNQSLKQEVARRCVQTVAGKYPFRKGGQAGEDVSFADLSGYFHPQGGTFWKFYQAKLQPAVQEENGRWVVKTSDLPIAPGFLDILYHTDLISQGLFGKGSPEPRVSFDIRPNGVPGVDEIRLKVDGRDLLYRNEKEEWHQFIWPGSTENSGAAIEVLFGGGKEPLTLKFDGRWGFFKLLDAGRVVQVSPTEYGLEWTVTPAGGPPAKVKFDLRTDSPKNPFVPGLFSKFRCPNQVGL